MILGDPAFLALAAPLLLLVLWARRRKPRAVDGGSERVLAGLPRSLRARTSWLPTVLLLLGTLCVVVALARPLKGREEARVVTEGIDIMLVVDTSSSMLQEGLERGLTNLDVVKEVVSDFIRRREADRVGIVSFAALPRTECPLTLDQEAALSYLSQVQCVQANGPEDGTAIGTALGHAARKLKDSDSASKVIVLLTDGENNVLEVDPEEAAALCAELGIRVYTVGAGTHIQRDVFFGRNVEIELRTELLEAIAGTTGGRFFRAKDADALTGVYEEIDDLERTEREDLRYTDFDDLYPWFLVPALALLLLGMLLQRGPYLELAA